MRSFVLWYKEGQKQEPVDIDVHINLWTIQNQKDEIYYFDFGFMIKDISNISSLCLYIPFSIKKEDVQDLGEKISKIRLVNALFNENFTTEEKTKTRLIVNENKENKNDKFIIYHLNIKDQVDLEEEHTREKEEPEEITGTILKIWNLKSLKNIEKEECENFKEEEFKVISEKAQDISKYYFRIRIKVPNKNEIIKEQINDESIFNNAFTSTEIIDFRLNNLRSCSKDLRKLYEQGNHFRIKTVHYLILREANDTIIHHENANSKMSSRLLEKEVWKEYLNDIDQDIIAYHIKATSKDNSENEENKIVEFTDLSRFQYSKANKKVITKYTRIIIAFGAIGSVFATFLIDIGIIVGKALQKIENNTLDILAIKVDIVLLIIGYIFVKFCIWHQVNMKNNKRKK